MKLPPTAHTSRPWRIHELTQDFEVEDVWALPTPGGPDDFGRLVDQFADAGFPAGAPLVVRVLWETRMTLGRVFGWDGESTGIGSRVPTLRDRLPADLRDAPIGPEVGELPFVPLYRIGDEWAAETANSTCHAVLHLSWVPDQDGYRGQLAVLVKPNGRLGAAYMSAIKPFRYLFVYPALLRMLGRGWQESGPQIAAP
ncbi:DUF2867 domain-containing protein [Kribbella sp. NPDC006257]|uniref:DUF2867 domain-containing protein n=1 Tax=Kribbella sp. NPDC006257 TaxID=3156738 RepID=UPI0033A40F6C